MNEETFSLSPKKGEYNKPKKMEKELEGHGSFHPDSNAATGNAGMVTAPMPGTVVRIERTEGDTVKAGELVLVLEAMKMENEITAPIDGSITKLNPATGRTVVGGEMLFEIQ